MAFSFLKNIASGINGVSGAIAQVADPLSQALNAFRGGRAALEDDPFNPRPTDAEVFASQIYRELADPNSALIARLTEQERQALAQSLSEQIAAMTRATRREQALGRDTGFNDRERRDEFVSFATQRGAPALALGAQSAARERLINAATGARGLLEPQAQRQQSRSGAIEKFLTGLSLQRQQSGAQTAQAAQRPVNQTFNFPITTGGINPNAPLQNPFGAQYIFQSGPRTTTQRF